MQGKDARSAETAVYIGCDVSKDWLDIHAHPIGKTWCVSNDKEGIKVLKRALARMDVTMIVLEATGRWHRHVWRSLSASGLPVAVIDPYRARRFAQATGSLEKGDRIDARVLALITEAIRPEAEVPPAKALEELQELVNAWHAAKEEVTALSNRRGATECAFLRRDLGHALRAMKNHVARLAAETCAASRPTSALRPAMPSCAPFPASGRWWRSPCSSCSTSLAASRPSASPSSPASRPWPGRAERCTHAGAFASAAPGCETFSTWPPSAPACAVRMRR